MSKSSIHDIERRAREQFAAANGWRLGKWFPFRDLVDRHHPNRDDAPDYHGTLLDHSHDECYREGRCPAAIAGHNYDGNHGDTKYGTEKITAFAARYGLIAHVAPAGKAASWYFPNHTNLIVITQPGVEIVWPTPQQMVTHAVALALARAEGY